MSFEAITLQYLEDALSECFQYHGALDNFLIRAGVPEDQLRLARKRAEERSLASSRVHSRAPKRFVVQGLLTALAGAGELGDRATASLITNVVKGTFPDATSNALGAIGLLKAQRDFDKKSKEQERREKEEEAREREREVERRKETIFTKAIQQRDGFRDRFNTLTMEPDSQKRGYLLEGFLNDFFAFEELKPRGPFRIVGEQLDGSFEWRHQTHLLEAKWVTDPVSGKDFGAFCYKIEGKTANTRGLLVSINGFSPEALKGLNTKGSLRFVCIDGAHLMRCFEVGQNLQAVLNTVWRHADETGDPYLPVNRFP